MPHGHDFGEPFGPHEIQDLAPGVAHFDGLQARHQARRGPLSHVARDQEDRGRARGRHHVQMRRHGGHERPRGPGAHLARRAQHGKPAFDPQPRIEGLGGHRRPAGDRHGHLPGLRSRFRQGGADLGAGSRVHRRLAGRQLQAGTRHHAHPRPRPERQFLSRPQPHGHDQAAGRVGVVVGGLAHAGPRTRAPASPGEQIQLQAPASGQRHVHAPRTQTPRRVEGGSLGGGGRARARRGGQARGSSGTACSRRRATTSTRASS